MTTRSMRGFFSREIGTIGSFAYRDSMKYVHIAKHTKDAIRIPPITYFS